MRAFQNYQKVLGIFFALLLFVSCSDGGESGEGEGGKAAESANQGVSIQRVIPFASGSGATKAVINECRLQASIPISIQAKASGVELVDELKPKKGRALNLTISKVHAKGGGPFSGARWIIVTGTLTSKGKTVGSFSAQRTSTKPANTCTVLGHIADVMTSDIASWLANPTMNAQLGEAH